MQKLEQQRSRSIAASQSSSQSAVQAELAKGFLWQGSLNWLGNDLASHVEKDFSVEVIANPANGDKMYVAFTLYT